MGKEDRGMEDATVFNLTFDEAERYYRAGLITLAQWEEYQILWRNSAFRFTHLAEGFDCTDTDT
jgi:hypothetical protein